MIRTVASAVERLLTPDIVTGLYQVGVATALALVVFAVAARAGLAVTREFGVSLVRGFVQVVAMGSLVGVLLTLELVWSGFVLVFMIGGATWISRNRGADLPGVTRASFVAISLGAGLVITTMVAAGVIERRAEALLPVGSMIIANAMKINSLALDRFQREVVDNRHRIETGLALGWSPSRVVTEHVEDSIRASLIPTIDSLKSLGWVWIPGIMTGMILAGENPLYAALYQFVIMAMIFAAGGLTSTTTSLLVSHNVFTDADQLRGVGDRTEAES